MRYIAKRVMRRSRLFRRRTQGIAAVEFAILGTVLLLIIGGVIDFGHAWYLKQLITNASREGARYGVAYQVDSTATRIKPNALSPSIHDHVTGLPSLAGLSVSVTPGPGATDGYTTGAKGKAVKVTVSVTKTWFILGSFLPASTLPTSIKASTEMLVE
jgi:Flp pilus assembly protein TadG